MKDKPNVSPVDLDDWQYYTAGMSFALIEGRLNDFREMNAGFHAVIDGIKERNPHIAHQMESVVAPIYIDRMRYALTDGKTDVFDAIYTDFCKVINNLRPRSAHTAHQMETQVAPLYERRQAMNLSDLTRISFPDLD